MVKEKKIYNIANQLAGSRWTQMLMQKIAEENEKEKRMFAVLDKLIFEYLSLNIMNILER